MHSTVQLSKGMINNLIRMRIDKVSVRWIRYMLENRKVIATMGNEQVTKDVEDGAPQGGGDLR